jgi:hypothetical protein
MQRAALIPLAAEAATLEEVVVTIDTAMAVMHQNARIVIVDKEIGAE